MAATNIATIVAAERRSILTDLDESKAIRATAGMLPATTGGSTKSKPAATATAGVSELMIFWLSGDEGDIPLLEVFA